ncbi:hypothetical protein Drorol1_Dr00016190 [Drosera rotundifolia]
MLSSAPSPKPSTKASPSRPTSPLPTNPNPALLFFSLLSPFSFLSSCPVLLSSSSHWIRGSPPPLSLPPAASITLPIRSSTRPDPITLLLHRLVFSSLSTSHRAQIRCTHLSLHIK